MSDISILRHVVILKKKKVILLGTRIMSYILLDMECPMQNSTTL